MTHYILKSEGDEFLLEAIGECIRSIERDMDMQDTLLKTKEETRLYKAMLRRNMVQTLLLIRVSGRATGTGRMKRWK